MSRLLNGILLLASGVFLLLGSEKAIAQGEADPAVAVEMAPATILEPVLVPGAIDVQATGESTIPREIIEKLPRGNGSVNEVLGILPDVQFSENSRSSLTGGEILPPDISISGGKFFDNYFTIDGMGNNSLLDSSVRNAREIDEVPANPQRLFLDSAMVDEIVLYDSNVPARLGGFTGGAVDVRLRRPEKRFGGRLDYRTTRDSWTRFHLSDEDRYDFSQSGSASRQPRFRKHDAGISLDLPVHRRLAFVADYRILESDIPLQLLDETEHQRRRNENLLLKGSLDLAPDTFLDATLLYAPYRAEFFIPDARNSRYEVDGGGNQFQLAIHRIFSAGEVQLQAAYTESENTRDAPSIWRNWAATDTKDWGRIVGSAYSHEGGFGDLERSQRSLELKAEVTWDLDPTGMLEQRLGVGAGMQWAEGVYERTEQAIVYKQPRTTPDVICGGDLEACVDGEQYFALRDIRDGIRLEEAMNSSFLYVEDQLLLGDLSLRPGLRLSYDDFTNNLNLAPRLAAQYDLLGDGRTLLLAGLNRYYGQTLLAFKLREALRPPRVEFRTTDQGALTDWLPDPDRPFSVARFSQLDTPYSDEAVFGVDQAMLGGRLSAKYVHRRGRDEFARSYGAVENDGLRYYTITNDGESEHDILRISWERSWTRHYLLASWTYLDSRTSNEDFNTVLRDEELEPRVWYRGQIVYLGELPRRDYGRPHVGKLLYQAQLPWGFQFTNLTRYVSHYSTVEYTGHTFEVPSNQRRVDSRTGQVEESLPLYERVDHQAGLIFDWKLGWRKSILLEQVLVLNLEVLNVFDEEIESGTDPGTYQLGRQFWAGLELQF